VAGIDPKESGGGGFRSSIRIIGPGLVIAATGVGAGDLIAAAVSGSRYGYAVIWAAVVGAVLKFALNEGLARWQLATGTTLLEGWVQHLGRWVQYVFLVYLVIWSFVVGGALIAACGTAAHALVPAVGFEAWGIVHSLVAAALVLLGGYKPFERLVSVFIGVMFVTLIGCAALIAPPHATLAALVTQATIPTGSTRYILGVIGGVGGSVTLLAYGYWIREKGWEGSGRLKTVRLDLGVAYILTGLFGVAVMILATETLFGTGVVVEGSDGVVTMATMVERSLGAAGRWTFLVGFWGAVATSMLGVWQGVPYLFADFVGLMRGASPDEQRRMVSTRSAWYRGFLVWLALPPLVLLVTKKPFELVVIYAVLGALFMPFLAATLLYLNHGRKRTGELRNRGWSVALLLICLGLFAYVAITKILSIVIGN
jgi:Mn2+/Fe2+ NRAMP family transporter